MSRRMYSLLLRLVLPFYLLHFLWRGWRNAANRGSVRERLALGIAARTDAPLWMHAASVGEVRALAALVHAMGPADMPLLVTVGTPTGCARARELFGGTHEVRAAPWDLPGATSRFLDAVRPRALVIVETELWPNLIAAAHARGVPIALVSARLSVRSLQRYRRFARGLMQSTVRALACIGAQSEADRLRLIRLGAAPGTVTVSGNLKFDVPLGAELSQQGAALRERHVPARPLWVAGSTHPGEEKLLLHAQRLLGDAARARGAPAPVLAFAPRRPERFESVARWLAQQGVAFACSSQAAAPSAMTDVILIDQMGVLTGWYAAADVTFVGGTLVPVGGHNLLEPAALARPVLTGPHTDNAPDVAHCLLRAGGAVLVRDAQQLAQCAGRWLDHPDEARSAGDSAASAVRANRGAGQRALALVRALATASAPSATG